MKRLLLFLSALAVTWMATAAGVPASPAKRPTYRYLFVIDNTSSLRAGTNAIQSSIYNILSTGAFGSMKPGDNYGILSFNNGEVDSRFPMQTWNPRAINQLSVNAGYYIRQMKFSGKSNLDKAVAAIKEIGKESQLLTVFIFSDGKDVLYGTPFDLPISTIYVQYYPEMSKAHRPFLTTLVMATGEFDGWAVEPAGGRVSIPNLTDAAIARLPKPPAPPKVEPPAPRPVRPPPQSIIVHGPVTPEKPMKPTVVPSVAPVPTPAPVVRVETPAPVTVVTPPPLEPVAVTLAPIPAAPVAPVPQPAPVVATAPPTPAPALQTVPVETKIVAAPPAPAPVIAVPPAPAPAPQPVTPAPAVVTPPAPVAVVAPVAKAPEKAPVPAVPLAAGTQSAKSNSNMLIPAVLILIVGVGFFVLYLRAGRRSNGGSLISRSIDQNHR